MADTEQRLDSFLQSINDDGLERLYTQLGECVQAAEDNTTAEHYERKAALVLAIGLFLQKGWAYER